MSRRARTDVWPYRLPMSENQWTHQEHDFSGPDGKWVAVTVTENGTVEVMYYDQHSAVVEHSIVDWIDDGRKHWCTTTKIAPGDPLPSIPAIE
jgi:hypothetical protein